MAELVETEREYVTKLDKLVNVSSLYEYCKTFLYSK